MPQVKHRLLCSAVALAFLCLPLSGCRGNGTVSADLDVKEQFLTVFCTYNYEGRYDALLEAWEEAIKDTTLKKLMKALDSYYSSIRSYASDAFYEGMIANRAIAKYEKLAYENGISYRCDGFTFEEYSKTDEKTTYTFIVRMIVVEADGTEKSGRIKGQITVLESTDTPLITNLYFSPLGFLPDNP